MRTRAIPFALFTSLALSACSDQGPPASSGMSQELAADLAEVVLEDQEALVDASTFETETGITVGSPAPLGSPPPCSPAITPSPAPNGDGDAVPDSIQLDFAGCTFTRGNFSFTLAGLIHVIDPTAAQAGFGLRLVFDNFSRERTSTLTSRTVLAEFNGTRQVTGNADAINHLITNFETRVTRPNLGTVIHNKNWNATFTTDVPGSIAHGQPLPSGVVNVAGSSSWSRGEGEVFGVTITTSGLHFNATCTVLPRFDAGSTVLVVNRRGKTHTVTIEHTACGQFTVTRS